ncbi:MAG: sigma-70 family RNA polymerase sigma factor [Acidobacteriota bacterium]|nr:sigma-70 family RNA polymerase sigma factor [Acidobacteriota bacterium]
MIPEEIQLAKLRRILLGLERWIMEAVGKVVERGVQEQLWTLQIRQIAAGDQVALGQLYDGTSRFVYGLALRILGDPGEAEEVTLDVYEQVWRQAGDYSLQRGTPLVWLTMLTRSRAIDRLRVAKRQRHREESLDEAHYFTSTLASPEEDALTVERRQLVQEALRSLNPDQRQAVELAYFHGMSHAEIAQYLGEPLGTVKTRIRSGMMKLREWLLPLQEGLQA